VASHPVTPSTYYDEATEAVITYRPGLLFATLIEEILHVRRSIQVRDCNRIYKPVRDLIDAGADLLESRIEHDPDMVMGQAEVCEWRLTFPLYTRLARKLHLHN
jgi:hypothetical protein